MPPGNPASVTATCLLLVYALMPLSISSAQERAREGYKGEKIVYAISPVGRAEYTDLGEVNADGQKLGCVTFEVRAMGFHDTETIYIDRQSGLPVKVERNVSNWLGRQYLVEHYDQGTFTLTIDKFKNKKKIQQYTFKKDGPIQNAILLPFNLRTAGDLRIGWEMKARFPQEFTIRLTSIDEVTLPAGKFPAYHFTSQPSKFEIWISQDDLRLPLKIKGLGGFGYTMVMKSHSLPPTATSRQTPGELPR